MHACVQHWNAHTTKRSKRERAKIAHKEGAHRSVGGAQKHVLPEPPEAHCRSLRAYRLDRRHRRKLCFRRVRPGVSFFTVRSRRCPRVLLCCWG